MNSILPFLAEYLGTFILAFIILSTSNLLIIGGAFVLIIAVIRSISGGLVNPALSLLLYLQGHLSQMELFGFIALQFVGAYSAYVLYHNI